WISDRDLSLLCRRRGAFDRPAAGVVPRYEPLELDLCTEAFEIAMDHGDRELPASAPIGYGAVSTLQRSRDLGLVPMFGVADIGETEIVLFGPEEWDVIEALAPAEDIVRGCLALALGDDPMFDTNPLTGQSVGPARDVAGGEDAWNAALEVLIDDDTAIDREPGLFRQRECWPHADPDDDEVGLKAFSAFQHHALLVYRGRCRGEVECHAMILMELAQEIADLRPQHFFHQDRLGPNYVNFDVPGTKRRR